MPLANSETLWEDHPTFTTIHRFKGLEAPVVILTGLGDIYQNKESMFYVALTRARHHPGIVDPPEILSKPIPIQRQSPPPPWYSLFLSCLSKTVSGLFLLKAFGFDWPIKTDTSDSLEGWRLILSRGCAIFIMYLKAGSLGLT